MRFDDPRWLLLLILIAPVAWTAWRGLPGMSPLRRWVCAIVRGAVIALLALALAGAATVRETNRLAVVAVVDVSGSVRRFAEQTDPATGAAVPALDAVRTFLREATLNRGPEDLLGVVAFDGRAIAVASPSRTDVLRRDLVPSVDGGTAEAETDIAGALRLARAMIPGDAAGRIVLASDGVQTTGDALRAVDERGGGGSGGGGVGGGWSRVPVDVVPLRFAIAREVVVERVDTPPSAAADAPLSVRVVLNATTASTGTLRLVREGEAVDVNGDEPGTGLRVTLAPGRTVVPLEVRLDSGRVHRFRAVYEPDVVAAGAGVESAGGAAGAGGAGDEGAGQAMPRATALSGDTTPDNNVAEGFTITPGRGLVLLVDGAIRDGGGAGAAADAAVVAGGTSGALAAALKASGLEVRRVGASAIPRDILSLEEFDLVLLDNVSVDAVPDATQEALLAFVRDLGGGLVFVGGPDALGAGGWRGSVLEPAMPVLLDLPDRLVAPELATVLVLDNSRSMLRPVLGSAVTQQDIANEAAALAVRSLDRTDELGVIAFNSSPRTVIPFGKNSDPAGAAALVRGIYSDGGTFAVPALERAREMLKGSDAKVRHVVLVTDGRSRGNDEMVPLARALKADGVRLTTIAVGDDADTKTLEEMAEANGGVFYQVTNPEVLPRIFLRAVRIVRSPLIKEGDIGAAVVSGGSPMVQGLGEAVPNLGGLVLTRARAEPTITLAMATGEGEPLLAHWNVGLGQVVVFTSDSGVRGGGASGDDAATVSGAWAREWLAWQGYQRLWTNIARSASRPDVQHGVRAMATIEDRELRLTLEALDESGRPLSGVLAPATVYTPSGEAIEARLTATAPGVYEARVAIEDAGSYVAVVKPQREGTRMAPVVAGATAPRGSEYRRLASDDALLGEIAARTGGRVLDVWRPKEARVFDREGVPPREAVTPLWPLLMVWLIAGFVADVAVRRVAWDRWVGSRYAVRVAREVAARAGLGGAGGVGGGEGAPGLGALRQAARDGASVVLVGAAGDAAGDGAGGDASGGGGAVLGDRDAEALRAAARDRRRAQRLGAYRADTGASGAAGAGGSAGTAGSSAGTRASRGVSPEAEATRAEVSRAADQADAKADAKAAAKDAGKDAVGKDGADQADSAGGAGSLLSAKRRARQRFEE